MVEVKNVTKAKSSSDIRIAKICEHASPNTTKEIFAIEKPEGERTVLDVGHILATTFKLEGNQKATTVEIVLTEKLSRPDIRSIKKLAADNFSAVKAVYLARTRRLDKTAL